MDTSSNPLGFDGVGFFHSRDEIERKAPRRPNTLAHTNVATYCYSREEWVLVSMAQYIPFKVVSRHHVTGRGYITVVHNPDLLPISCEYSAVCKGQYRLPIHAIERSGTLMENPRIHPDWGIVTSEETEGDELLIRMYPSPMETDTVLRCNDGNEGIQ